MTRQRYASESKWEPLVGYSRAVRVGRHVFVSGTTATDVDGRIIGAADAALQAEKCFEKVEQALSEAGASIEDVVRTRMYLADINDWEGVGEVHRRLFSDIRPAATMVEVSRFIAPDILVEVEVDAVISS